MHTAIVADAYPQGSFQRSNAANDTYVTRVRQSVASVESAFRAMRRPVFTERLADFGELNREENVHSFVPQMPTACCCSISARIRTFYRPAQNLLRQAFSTVESRADCFRILFQINHASSLRALADYLQIFITATTKMIEANDLAKWMVRSFADIVNVLAGSTDGILRPGTSWTLIEDRSTLQAVALKAPSIWRLMCESVSSIFKRTPSWSQLLAREEMVAWFRDVTIFCLRDGRCTRCLSPRRASGCRSAFISMDGQVSADDADELESAEDEMMVRALALPLESAVSWLRMNDEDILRETQSFILKALDQFGSEYDLPARSKTKMLGFINEQMGIKEASARHTLLSIDELADLKVRLDPTQALSRSATRTTIPIASLPTPRRRSRRRMRCRARSPHHRRRSNVWTTLVQHQERRRGRQHRRRRLPLQAVSRAKPTMPIGGLASAISECSARARSNEERTNSSSPSSASRKSTPTTSLTSTKRIAPREVSRNPSRSISLDQSTHLRLLPLRLSMLTVVHPLEASTPQVHRQAQGPASRRAAQANWHSCVRNWVVQVVPSGRRTSTFDPEKIAGAAIMKMTLPSKLRLLSAR